MQQILLISLAMLFNWNCILAQSSLHEKIQGEFTKMLKEEDLHNGFLQVKSVDGSLNLKYVGGEFQDGTQVSEANPFHAASVGKMFTATLIMKLMEEGKLKPEDPISKHLPADILEGLHVYEGEDLSHQITLIHLLQHTSGLPDYITDSPVDGSPDLLSLVLQDPDKFREVEEMLAFSKEKLRARFPPGTDYYYTDTAYLLLGLIIESKYQKAFHQVLSMVYFEPLKMENTALFGRSETGGSRARMAEFYIGETEISSYRGLSIDWAGGGLVTTTEDLLKFQEALFSGEIIKQSSLKRMQSRYKESKATYYGFGLRRYVLREFSELLPDLNLIGHSGVNSSFAFYCPELEIFLTGTFNQTNQPERTIEFLIEILVTLKDN